MLFFNISIDNPFMTFRKSILDKTWDIPKHITHELRVMFCRTMLEFGLVINIKGTHPGIEFSIALLGLYLRYEFYDNRHPGDEDAMSKSFGN